ncbi:MAG: hypothetical protein FJZ01_19170 [Candidatus Sericytochromatia bacterium]|nr:hypothetical protein [Candidatus Tanganyikabacteria bacterium]
MPTDRILIGVDDTDYGDSIGTGGFARELQLKLVHDLGAVPLGVTRHQLFVHPDIPYTSHNSAACIAIECSADLGQVAALCKDFVAFMFHPGADPGLCIAPAGRPAAEVLAFGQRAQTSVLTLAEAEELGKAAGWGLWGLGGTNGGMIGALCAVGLRMGGDDGKFLSLRGIRSIPKGAIAVSALKERTSIEIVRDTAGRDLADEETVIARHGVRPELARGRIVLTVEERDGAFATLPGKKGDDA